MSITNELLRKFAGPNHEGPHHDMAGELLALRARVAKLEAALREFLDRLDEIHDAPAYKSVWTVNQLHMGPYQGPTYTEAFAKARAVLSGKDMKDESLADHHAGSANLG